MRIAEPITTNPEHMRTRRFIDENKRKEELKKLVITPVNDQAVKANLPAPIKGGDPSAINTIKTTGSSPSGSLFNRAIHQVKVTPTLQYTIVVAALGAIGYSIIKLKEQ